MAKDNREKKGMRLIHYVPDYVVFDLETTGVSVYKDDIIEISEKIGAFETSIQPFEDCCTIFVAKHPVTKPNLNVIKKSEQNLEEKIEEMLETAVSTAEVIHIR